MFDFEYLPEDMDKPAAAKPTEDDVQEELDQRWERIGNVTAMVYMPPGAERVPLAVVLVPGNPGVDVVGPGTYHAFSPGQHAISEALRKARVPFVHYDYEGIGLSSPEGPTDDKSKWTAPGSDVTERNTRDVIRWAKSCLSDRVVACCWNYGACDAAHLALEGQLHAFMSVSLGYNVYMSYFIMGARPAGEMLKAWYDKFNASITCKTLYVVGSMDKAMTPLGHVKRLIKERPDGGENATVHIIEQKGKQMSNDEFFQLKGSEEEVGDVCLKYVQGLQKELQDDAASTLLGA